MSFLYREAGRVLQGVEDGRASLKTLTLGRANSVGGGRGGDENGPKRKLYAMVSETLRYKPLLDRLVLKADPRGALFSDEHMREKAQGYVMLYEMLLGKGTIQGGGKLKRHLLQYKERLEHCLAEAKLAEGLPANAANEFLLPKSSRRHIFPRYARVNLLTCPEGTKGVAAALQKEGFTVKIDAVVPSLLVLPPGTDLHEHAMVKEGRLVLQDKSSCFSAEALLGEEAFAASKDAGREWKGGDVIDACAAPGNKTMHAASLLSQLPPPSASKEDRPKATVFGRKKKRIVFAFDKDLRRLTLMRRRIDEAGASGAIETRLQDFLEVDTSDKRFAAVGAILLDPSCSGSGIVSAPDRIHENQGAEGEGGSGGDQSRVSRLAAFQLQGLLKAMSFPQVQRICYSTCSVHAEENEDVVAKALEQQPTPPRLDPSLVDLQTKVVAVAASASTPVGVSNKMVAEAPAASAGQLNAESAPSSSISSGSKHVSNSSGNTNSSNVNLGTGDSLVNPRAAVLSESLSESSGEGSASAKSNGCGGNGGGSSGGSGGGSSAAFGSGSERFKLSRCLSRWPRRGLAVSGLSKKQAACLVRTDPFEDETNGFFVAVFERESGVRVPGVGGEGDGGGGGGGPEVEGKKKRNRHKNRKKNKKKRKREEAEGGGGGEAGQEGEKTQDLGSASKIASNGDINAVLGVVEEQQR